MTMMFLEQDPRSYAYRAPPSSPAELARYAAAYNTSVQKTSCCDWVFSYYTWAFLLVLVLFIILAMLSNWSEVTVQNPSSGEAATAIAFVLMGLLAFSLLCWCVYAIVGGCWPPGMWDDAYDQKQYYYFDGNGRDYYGNGNYKRV